MAVDKTSIAVIAVNIVRFIWTFLRFNIFSVSLFYHRKKRPSKNFRVWKKTNIVVRLIYIVWQAHFSSCRLLSAVAEQTPYREFFQKIQYLFSNSYRIYNVVIRWIAVSFYVRNSGIFYYLHPFLCSVPNICFYHITRMQRKQPFAAAFSHLHKGYFTQVSELSCVFARCVFADSHIE